MDVFVRGGKFLRMGDEKFILMLSLYHVATTIRKQKNGITQETPSC